MHPISDTDLDSLWKDPRPYDKMTVDTDSRCYGRLAREDYLFLRYLDTKRSSILQVSINIFLHRLIAECKKRNINDLSNLNEFKRLVLGLSFGESITNNNTNGGNVSGAQPMGFLPPSGGTSPLPHGETSRPNDAGGATSSSPSMESSTNDESDVKNRTPRRRGRYSKRSEEEGEKTKRRGHAKGESGD